MIVNHISNPQLYFSITLHHHQSYRHPSLLLHIRHGRFLTLDPPPCLLISSGPLLLDVAQSLLDLVHRVQITRVLSNVIADLDRRTAGGRGDFDDDVEGCGLCARGRMGKVICGWLAGLMIMGKPDTYWSKKSQCQK